jgi:hypothetical protein
MTVAELGARLSSAEFTEWQLYDALEGLPDVRADWRAGLIASTLANIHRKPGRPPFQPRDFMPRREPERLPRQPIEGLATYLERLAR